MGEYTARVCNYGDDPDANYVQSLWGLTEEEICGEYLMQSSRHVVYLHVVVKDFFTPPAHIFCIKNSSYASSTAVGRSSGNQRNILCKKLRNSSLSSSDNCSSRVSSCFSGIVYRTLPIPCNTNVKR